jgi:hypothetical protein
VADGEGGVKILIGIIALIAAITLTTNDVAANAVGNKPVEALIERDGARWSVEYRLNANQKIWAFPRSKPDRLLAKSWRGRSWIVTTKGVRLSQMDGFDVLVADNGFVPKQVKILFVPWADDLQADYDPALQFSTGDIALFDGHFNITPYVPEKGLVDANAAQVNRFVDKGRSIWGKGKSHSSATFSGDPNYVLFGDLKPMESERLQTIIDPGMPDWLRTNMNAFVPRLVDDFARQFGVEGLDQKPSIWAVWGGGSLQGISTGGSVLPGFISMVLKGDGLVAENKDAKERLYWFLAHEVAHFWLGQRANYAGDGHQWISEGGANAAAMLYLKTNLPDYDFATEYANQVEDCRKSAKKGAIRTGYQRHDYQGYYACGAIFNLVADKFARENGSDFFGFNGALIKHADASDRKISGEEWLESFAKIANDARLAEAMVRLLEGTSSEVDKDIDFLLSHTGVDSQKIISHRSS